MEVGEPFYWNIPNRGLTSLSDGESGTSKQFLDLRNQNQNQKLVVYLEAPEVDPKIFCFSSVVR